MPRTIETTISCSIASTTMTRRCQVDRLHWQPVRTTPKSSASSQITSTPNTVANNANRLQLDPTMQAIFAQYPNPTSSADGLSGTIFYPSSSRQNSWQGVAKIDHRFTDKHSVMLRYGYNDFSDPNSSHDD